MTPTPDPRTLVADSVPRREGRCPVCGAPSGFPCVVEGTRGWIHVERAAAAATSSPAELPQQRLQIGWWHRGWWAPDDLHVEWHWSPWRFLELNDRGQTIHGYDEDDAAQQYAPAYLDPADVRNGSASAADQERRWTEDGGAEEWAAKRAAREDARP